jgi:hypothetical protein
MQYSLQAMELALRVLTALTEKRNPSPEDANRLRAIAAATGTCEMPLDDLACEVIQQALKHRAQVRKKAAY